MASAKEFVAKHGLAIGSPSTIVFNSSGVLQASALSGTAISITGIDIDGGTDIGADLVDADLLIVDDGAGGTNRKTALSRIKKYVYSAVSGDATVSDTGALTIAATSVENSMLAGSIANSKLTNSTVTVTAGDGLSGGGSVSLGSSVSLAVGVDDSSIETSSDQLRVKALGVTNAMLAGSIAASKLAGSIGNAKLTNSTVSYGGVSLALGASDATPAFDLSDATNYPTSSLSGTITNAQLAGSIANDKLTNSSVNFGGVSVALGASDSTPAFDLSDATGYPTSSLTGTITNTQLAGSIAASKLAGSIGNAKLTNSTITVSDGSNSTATALGGTITFAGTANEVEVAESSGTITVGLPDNVTIAGNLTVSGTTTTINSNTLNIGDNIITLNSDETGTPSQNAGIEVERGTGTNVQLRWNETSDKWQFTNDGSSYEDIGAGITVQEEGSALSTAATTLNFVGSNVTATGAGATKTITIGAGGIANLAADTSPSLGGTLDTDGQNINFRDSGGTTDDRLNFGNSQDLSIYHSGSASFIENDTGILNIVSANDSDVRIKGSAGIMAFFEDGAGVTLQYNGSQKFETTNAGINVTGNILVSGTVDGVDVAALSTSISGKLSDVVSDTTPQLGGDLDLNGSSIIGSGHIDIGDNNRLKLGASDDLQIYHDGSHSYIDETGTGYLILKASEIQIQSDGGEDMAKFEPDGSVRLYHNNVEKITTTANGVTVAGNIVVSGTVDGVDVAALNTTASGKLSEVVEDGTPQLGGNLDLNSNNITGTGNINITGGTTVSGTNTVAGLSELSGAQFDGNVTPTSGQGVEIFAPDTSTGQIQSFDRTNSNFDKLIIKGDPVEIYDGSTKRIETTNSGATVTGTLTATAFSGDGSSLTGISAGNSVTNGSNDRVLTSTGGNGINAESDFQFDGTNVFIPAEIRHIGDPDTKLGFTTNTITLTAGGTAIQTMTSSQIKIPDSKEMAFGTADDMTIMHDGNNSEIRNRTGELQVRANTVKLKNNDNNATYLSGVNGGAVELYHNNNKKLETTSAGATVTGTVTATAFSGDGSALTGISGGSSDVVDDTTPQLGGNLDANDKKIQNVNKLGIGVTSVDAANMMEVEKSGENNVVFAGNDTAIGARLTLKNKNTGSNALNQIDFSDAGGQSTSSIKGFNTNQSSNYGELAFFTRDQAGSPPAERVRIDYEGNVGVGKSSPTTKLDVNGTIKATAFQGDGSSLTGVGGDVVSDTTPQLGGNLDAQTNNITDVGVIGIGTSSPNGMLELDGKTDSSPSMYISHNGNSSVGSLIGFHNGNDMRIWNYENGVFKFGNNNSEIMRFLANGNVGIGTQSPNQKLHVNGNITATNYFGDGSNLTGISGGLSDVVSDTTPQLGGDLDAQTNDITNLGKIGIGTTSPSTLLHAINAGAAQVRLGYNTSKYVDIGRASNGDYQIMVQENGGPLVFGTAESSDGGGAEKMRIDRFGKVGIGTNSPSTALDVSGTVTATAFAGTLSTAAQANITSLGTLTALAVSGATNLGIVQTETLAIENPASHHTYTTTVASKTSAHPYTGQGSSNAYFLDGKESPSIILAPNMTYRFDQSSNTNSGHPLRFYLEADKTTAYTTGVTTNGTAGNSGAYTQIVVTDATPPVLYYQCSSHGYMGSVASSLTEGTTDHLTEGATNLYYTNARVDTHLNTGSASSGQILSWNGSDYAWVADQTGGGGSSLTVQDEGSALSTAATTLNFVGAGVTASGTGAEKTITISGTGSTTAYTPAPKFARLTVTANQTLSGSATTIITAFNTRVTDTSDSNALTSTLADGKFIIPAGVSKIKLRASVWIADVAGQTIVNFYKNGSIVEGTSSAEVQSDGGDFPSSTSGILSVSQNDYFQVACYHADSGTVETTYNERSWFELEVVEGSILGGLGNLSTLQDVNNASPTDGQALVWDNSNSYWAPGTVGAAITVQDEGSALSTSATTLNFVGSGVTASGTGATKTITISGGGGGSSLAIKDEGSTLSTDATTLNFVGAGVTASGTGAEKTITISGGGGGGSTTNFGGEFGVYTGNGSTTTFTSPLNTSHANNIIVSVDGLMQRPTTDYTISGTTVTFGTAPPAGTTVMIRSFSGELNTKATVNLQNFVGNGSNTVYKLVESVSHANDVLVTINGIFQRPGSDYTYNTGTSNITFDEAPTLNDVISFRTFDVQARQGASVTVSDTAPTSPQSGDLWFDSTTAKMYLRYNDGSSNQWISTSTPGQQGPGVGLYANVGAFPGSGNTQGDFAIAQDTKALYIWDGTEWDRLNAGGDETPRLTTTPASTHNLSGTGTNTAITIAASDPEGFPITYSYDTNPANPNQITNVVENNGVFTLVPSTNNAHAGSFTLRLKASDGVHITSHPITVSLAFNTTFTFDTSTAVINSNYTTDNKFEAYVRQHASSVTAISQQSGKLGKGYLEMKIISSTNIANLMLGVQVGTSTSEYYTGGAFLHTSTGKNWPDNSYTYGIGNTTFGVNDIIMVAYDTAAGSNGQVWFGKNGSWHRNPASTTGYEVNSDASSVGFRPAADGSTASNETHQIEIISHTQGAQYTIPTGWALA